MNKVILLILEINNVKYPLSLISYKINNPLIYYNLNKKSSLIKIKIHLNLNKKSWL